MKRASARRAPSVEAADLACVGLLFVLVFVFLRPLLALKSVYSCYDYPRFVYPLYHWLHGRFSAGRGVFWDQSSGLGDPILDTSISTYFYFPQRWIITFLDAVPAVALCMVLHYCVAALGSYCLARSRKASASASFLAAVAVVFGGGMTESTSSFGLMIPLAWFPWMILGLLYIEDASQDPLAKAKGAAGAAMLGLSTGLALLGGHIGMGLCQVYALAVLYLAYALMGEGRLRRAKACLPWLSLAVLIGALLYGGQAMALSRVAAQAGRSHAYTEAQAAEGAMNPVTLGQVVLPYLLGRLKDATFLGQSWRFGTNDPQGLVLYCGVAAFIVLVFFVVTARWRQILPWAAAWAFLVLYALGNWTPAFGLFYYRLPLLGNLHWAVRAAAQTGPLLCVPIALGLDALRKSRPAWPGRLALGLGAALILAALALKAADPLIQSKGRAFVLTHIAGQALHPYPAAFYLDKLTRWLGGVRRHLAGQGAWALATGLALLALVRVKTEAALPWLVLGLGLLLFAELSANLSDYNPMLPRSFLDTKPASVAMIQKFEGPAAQPFRSMEWGLGAQLRRSFPKGRFDGDLEGELRNNELLAPDLHKFYGLDLCNSYPSANLVRLDAFTGWYKDLNMDPPQPVTELLAHRRLVDLSGAKYLLLAEPLKAAGLTPLMSDPVYLYRNEQALPLAYVAQHYSDGWTSASAVDALTSPASAQRAWSKPALVEGKNVGTGLGKGRVTWVKYSDLEWDLDVASQGPGVLALSRLYYPGPWKASINGLPVDILAANGALCALPLKGGLERVRLYYDDPLPARGMALQYLGYILALAGLAVAFFRRRPRGR